MFLAIAWIATNLIGAWMAYDHDRAYDLSWLDQPGRVAQIGNDWLYGWGTGLAMPLWVLAGAAVLAVAVTFGGEAGRLAAALTMVLGGLSLAYSLTNQLTYDRFEATGTERGETALIFASLLLAALLVLIGLITVITTPRARRRRE